MRRGGADGADDPLADTRDDRLLPRAADQAVQVGADRHAGAGLHLNPVQRNAVHGRAPLFRVRAVNHLRLHARLHRVEHVASGQVNRARAIEVQLDVRLVGRDQRGHHVLDVPAGQVVRLQLLRAEIQARLHRRDAGIHDGARIHAPQTHEDQREEGDVRPGHRGANIEHPVLEHQNDEDKAQQPKQRQKEERKPSGNALRKIQRADIEHAHTLLVEEPVTPLS